MAARRNPGTRVRPRAADPPDTGAGGVPDHVTDQARATFERSAPGELAPLVFDSLVDEGATPADHRLRFEHPALQVDVHVSAAPEGTMLAGVTTASVRHRVELQFEGARESLVDDGTEATFHFDRVPHGLVRLRLTGPPGTPAFRTDWFRV